MTDTQRFSMAALRCTCMFVLISSISAKIYLEKLSTLYLPYKYENGEAKYQYDEKPVERFTYDSEEKLVYTVGDRMIYVLDVTNVTKTVILYNKTILNSAMKDVEFCGGYVIISRVDNLNNDNGIVEIYGKYNRATQTLPLLRTVQVGKDPDMVVPLSDCKTILVSLEAEAYPNPAASQLIDPPGGVGIIKFTSTDLSQMPTYKKVDFSAFNNRWEDLVQRGARFVYRENNNTFGNDLEPESITLNSDETKAYIALQENNAVAELDLATENITTIYPLGFKNWTTSRLDVSDKDNKINIRSWPVYGMYQPDIIQYFMVGGKAYLVSANEGASKDYSDDVVNGFNEEVRAADLQFEGDSEVLNWASQNGFTSSSISEKKNLGRLIVTNIEGKANESKKFDALYTFGARSFSIWRVEDMVKVYDSGSELEDKIKEVRPDIFNADAEEEKYSLQATKDAMSTKKGPEPEMVTVGVYKGKTLLCVTCEQPGMIFVYSIDDDVTKPKFEDMWIGIPKGNKTWEQLYSERTVSEIDPEDLRFVDKSNSPNNQTLLMAIGAVTGTFSIFQVKDVKDPNPTGAAATWSPFTSWFISIMVILLWVQKLL